MTTAVTTTLPTAALGPTIQRKPRIMRLTFNAKGGAAACAASVVLGLTGVNAIIVKAGGQQFQDRHRVTKRRCAVSPVRDFSIVFVPGDFQRGGSTDFAL